MATWGPLAGGVLSGKFTRPGGSEAGTRIAPESLGVREHTAARVLQEVADEVGATPSQVAIAWTRARSRAVHPIVGARTAEQLKDNLNALDVTLQGDAVRRLDGAAEFTLGVPGDFIAGVPPGVFGEGSDRFDGR
ncbi:MAG: putative oxidoreductase, aryl-alcohol dehydrogenase like protein [Streptosporangiaceae bacterium]|nr:putative oxidoreductase, aryl-alcohol dehydrogenase like protein [Streptosporangiaceae bacterium]